MTAVGKPAYEPTCSNCGQPIERKDDGAFWHVEGYAGYVQCRLVATAAWRQA